MGGFAVAVAVVGLAVGQSLAGGYPVAVVAVD